MKNYFFGVIVISSMFLASCAKESSIETDNTIKFNGKISNLQATSNTGTSSTTWSSNDEIGIFMVNSGGAIVAEGNSNRRYIYTNSVFSPASIDQNIYYPVSDSKVDFIAYYPYKSSANLSSLLAIDVADQRNQANIDLLHVISANNGLGFNKTAGTNVPLTFDHKLSKVIIKPIAGQGLNNSSSAWRDMIVTLTGFNTRGNFNLATGLMSNISTPLSITPFTRILGTSYEAIVVPSVYRNQGDISISFEISGENYVWRSVGAEMFEPGKEYAFELTINKTGLVLSSVTINDWVSTTPRVGVAN